MELRLRYKVAIGVFAALFIVYWAVCYNLVSLALVPSYMEKTEVFESVTDSSLAALVQTDDIRDNHARLLGETREWLKSAAVEKISAVTADGYRLVAAVFAPQEESSDWALLLHGYTGWKEELYPVAYQFVQHGYHVLVPDMRCSGESEGDFIGMGWTDRVDNRLWLSEILSRDGDAEIVIYGQSMGGACALMMSGEELPAQVRAVISDSGYTDAYGMFAKEMKDWFSIPSFPLLDSMNLVLRLRGGYDLKEASALEAVGKTLLPVLLIHGEEDDMVPVSMAYALQEASGARLLVVPGAGHTQAADKDPELYYGTVFAFLEEVRRQADGNGEA